MLKLKVKNFGPLKDIDIELKQVNLFIGENGTGKSVLGKLISLLTGINNDLFIKAEMINDLEVRKRFDTLHINFLKDNTKILFSNITNDQMDFKFQFTNNKSSLKYTQSASDFITIKKESLQKAKEDAIKLFGENAVRNNPDLINSLLKLKIDSINEVTPRPQGYFDLTNVFLKNKFDYAPYLPAERNLTALLTKSLASFLTADLPIPKYLLDFTSLFEKARNKIRELSFLNFRYEYDGQNDKVYYNDTEFQHLHQSSSGLQAVIPLMVVIKYLSEKAADMIVEEPEINLFPKAQYELVKFLISQRKEFHTGDSQRLYLMTHSPYILTSLNNLIYAYKISQKSKAAKKSVLDIFKESELIDPDQFTAYVLENGTARSIVDPETGLIGENAIDDTSEDIDEDFEMLLDIR